MSYTPPSLSVTITLTGGYSAPALTETVTPGEAVVIAGTLAATLPSVALPPLSLSATGMYSPVTEGTLSAALPPSAPPLSLSATGLMAQGTTPYAPPLLADTVTLTSGYTPLPMVNPVVLGAPFNFGRIAASLPAVSLPTLTLSATRVPVWIAGLAATLPAVALPLLTAQIAVSLVYSAALQATMPAVILPPLVLSGTAYQDVALPDAAGVGAGLPSAQAIKAASGITLSQQAAQALSRRLETTAAAALPIIVGSEWRAAQGLPARLRLTLTETSARPLRCGTEFRQQEAHRQRRPLTERAAHGLPRHRGASFGHAEQIRTRNRRTLTEQQALTQARRLGIGQHQARKTANRLTLRWASAIWTAPGLWWPFYRVPWLAQPATLYPDYHPRDLRCVVLISWRPIQQPYCYYEEGGQATVFVPIQEVYVVINTFSLVRADTSQEIDVNEFSATLTADSWGWSWSATVPASQETLIRSTSLGDYVELIATLNGTELRLVVEQWSRERSFGRSSIKISGRGRAAWLADPNSLIQTTTNTQTRTAQQLVNDALMINGVSIGWSVDWQLEDWTVPAGAFSHTGSYISAALRVAEAGGGYVQADDALQTLHLLPWYPVAPWGWATETPDVALPEDVCTTEGIEWSDKAPYNAVWIAGGDTGGRLDFVKRTGTAGDVQAQTLADPLATDPIMTRQRGLRVLADTGRQARIRLSLPVLPETGIIHPGQLISYSEQGVEHRGLSRAVQVRWDFPKARQTVEIETHELESV